MVKKKKGASELTSTFLKDLQKIREERHEERKQAKSFRLP